MPRLRHPAGRPLRGQDLVRFLAVRNPTLSEEECVFLAASESARPAGEKVREAEGNPLRLSPPTSEPAVTG